VQPDFDQTPWDEDINNNLAILDAAYGKFITIAGLTGAWLNNTMYVVGQVTVDGVSSTMWQCLVSHTSAATPTTFAQDRAAHPSYWTSVGAVLVYLPISGGTLTGGLGVTGNLNITGTTTVGTLLNAGTVQATAGVTANIVTANTLVATTMNNGGTISTNTLNATSATATNITGGTVAASSTFSLPVSGGYLTANATTVEFAQDAGGWRWEYVRSNGTMRWINGSTGQTLMSIDSAGNMILRGTITTSGSPVLDAEE
jgi:hypothetical protein